MPVNHARTGVLIVISIAVLIAATIAALAPAWWLAGRILDADTRPFFRLLVAAGVGVIAYLSVVNLVARFTGHSTIVATAYLVACVAGSVVLWRRWPREMSIASLRDSWRDWAPMLGVAMVLGFPQWVMAISSPYWDEVAASAIHLTAANQFAEGVFPPRHNSLPNVPVKYHYGFTVLSGTVHWLTGFMANYSVDIVSTALWLFAFLFIVYWLRHMKFDRVPALWGGAAALLGGGLTWLYVKKIEAFSLFYKSPPVSDRLRMFSPDSSMAWNLFGTVRVPSTYLRNGDGSLSNLPWDILAQFQQHAVAIGLALTLPALFLFVRWQTAKSYKKTLAALTIGACAVLLLAHAVFGGVTAVTGGLVLLGLWLRAPTRERFVNGIAFGVGVAVIALLHGGFLQRGAEYGSSAEVLTLRKGFGYSSGGVVGFINWNIAGFGIVLLLALVAWVVMSRRVVKEGIPKTASDVPTSHFALLVFSVFALFSDFLPQFAYYSSESSGIEQQTEISKFFFAAHLGLALVSSYGVAALAKRVHWAAWIPLGGAMAVTPVLFAFVQSTGLGGASQKPNPYKWLGYYRSPYYRNSVEEQMGRTFKRLKSGPYEAYFDASADERKTGFVNELLIFGGSAFSATPSAYERSGLGYRLGEAPVARRFVESSRMQRLLPGAPEQCDCRFYYARPVMDMVFMPTFVRARFAKMLAEGYLTQRNAGADRVLYTIDKPTADLDAGIERYWKPRVVMQAKSDWDGDGRKDLIFYDYVRRAAIIGSTVVPVPGPAATEFTQLYVGRFLGSRKADLLFGRAADTDFRLGKKIEDIVEASWWKWTYRPSASGNWLPEYERFFWNTDIPLIGDVNGSGVDGHLAYRPKTGEWYAAPNTRIEGPSAAMATQPLPFAGRFLRGSRADLGVWSKTTSTFSIKSMTNGTTAQFRWGGNPGDVLVPGDYDGAGYDQLAIWNPTNFFWYWRTVPDGAITQFQFGSATGIPVPFDYNHDGRLDAAYWEPAQRKIYVTFSRGQRVDMTINVPPNAIPAFVNVL